MTKRRKFLISAIVLGMAFWMVQYVSLEYRVLAVIILGFLAYGTTVYSLKEDLRGVEWLTLVILPVMYTVSIGFFYYLLPQHFFSRLVITLLFAIGMYAVLLTENIFSVAAIRTIQLLRAAHAVGFLVTVLTAVLLYNAIFSLHWLYWGNTLACFFVGIPLFLQALWSVKLEDKLTVGLWSASLVLALITAELGMVMSFLPVTVWVASLFLGTAVYVIIGLMQQSLQERLFPRTIWEYVGVGLIVLMATLIITPWK